MKKTMLVILLGLCLGISNISYATEGGGGMYPNGNENYLVGALPPPGFYTMLYGAY
jgi:hypothetical protein